MIVGLKQINLYIFVNVFIINFLVLIIYGKNYKRDYFYPNHGWLVDFYTNCVKCLPKR